MEFENIKLKFRCLPSPRTRFEKNNSKYIHKGSNRREYLQDTFSCSDDINLVASERDICIEQKTSSECVFKPKQEVYVSETVNDLGNTPGVALKDLVVCIKRLKPEVFLKKCTVLLPKLPLNCTNASDTSSFAWFEAEKSEESSCEFLSGTHQKFKPEINQSNNNSYQDNSSCDIESCISQISSVINISLQCLDNINENHCKTSTLNMVKFDSDSNKDSSTGFSKSMSHGTSAEAFEINDNIHKAKRSSLGKFESVCSSDFDLSVNPEKVNHSENNDQTVSSRHTLKKPSVDLESLPRNSLGNLSESSNETSCVISTKTDHIGGKILKRKKLSDETSELDSDEKNVAKLSNSLSYITTQANDLNRKTHKRRRFESNSNDEKI